MTKTSSIWAKDVENRGAGPVERNTVVSILTLKQARNSRQQKIITIRLVVGRKKDLQKKPIVLEDIRDIVGSAGSL
jgi:hypothetical protein